MPRPKEPYTIEKRSGSKTFLLNLNATSGLSPRVCDEWQRKSFQNFPAELAIHSNPKTRSAAGTAARALIEYLKKKQEEGNGRRKTTGDITVGEWIERFTKIETSPRTGINMSKNRPPSIDTFNSYREWHAHIVGDPFTELKMAETEEEDAIEFITRMSLKKLKDGRMMGGTRTYVGVINFTMMCFNSYHRNNRRWINPFQFIDSLKHEPPEKDFLPEDETIALFSTPGVFKRPMELGVCAAIFLSGFRRAEVPALKPEDLDWVTPQIRVRRAWQSFDNKDRVLGPPKSKKERITPFDEILQEAIKKIWADYGQHEYVFSWKNGKAIGPKWIGRNLKIWIERAGIELGGRIITPHSSRHSLASILEERNESLRHIQELLGHASFKTTKSYLHSTGKTIRNMGNKISETMKQKEEEAKVIPFKVG